MKKKEKLTRIGEKFDKEIREIIVKRRSEIDKDLPREISRQRLTDGIVLSQKWQELKKELLNMPTKEKLGRKEYK